MKIYERSLPVEADKYPDLGISESIRTALQAINNREIEFVVNDTCCYRKNRLGKPTPCVVNSAGYLSKRFQDNLRSNGWETEATLSNQRIDAFKEFVVPRTEYSVQEDKFVEFAVKYYKCYDQKVRLDTDFSRTFHRLTTRSVGSVEELEKPLRKYLISNNPRDRLRVGVEFETGNLASSFRALSKLNTLYVDDFIDLGIFVTSIDKPNSATRIWPTSNRNGSFQELDERNYGENLVVPLWEFGFAPDSFSSNAKYLRSDGGEYDLVKTGESYAHEGRSYAVWKDESGADILVRC